MTGKTKKITFRLTEAEYKDISERIPLRADKQPIMKLSTFIRAAIFQQKVVAVDREVERYKAYSSARISNNINQIAHRLNSDYKAKTINQTTYHSVLSELAKIRKELRVLLAPLG